MADHCLPGPGEEEENVEQQKQELEALFSIFTEEITVLKEDAEYLVCRSTPLRVLIPRPLLHTIINRW